jgi:hypothetical protein
LKNPSSFCITRHAPRSQGKNDIREAKSRLGRPQADHVTLAEHSLRLDGRVNRIEKRLDLVEG